MLDLIKQELAEAQAVLESFMNNPLHLQQIEQAARLMADALNDGRKIISCGNGGSHCDAMHFAEELSGRYRENRPSMAAIAISDSSHITCVGNDYGYDFVFSRFIEGLGQAGDVLMGISTSGNSGNVIQAVEAARAKGMRVVLLTGKDGGKLAGQADVEIRVPHFGYADRIQEIHIKVIHLFILLIEKMVAGSSVAGSPVA
ncbi:D-sedoheptulose 7-phosphate isomerase [Rudanella paleaurantiibacter]|uniref:Phosphoheptose isomerase n=1 Tax=Rudanella paleaurantiibacter TaxID=2614655 RepID=A0A7J5TTN6_9BACT|nr:D-sedoheptulose 7-phosphate isomerase [Rudanella paleaurantiibacter]KAB7727120.1 D-sedoheptulose 7-phosphate isomerase [Rudanella paleaurantiibacter]